MRQLRFVAIAFLTILLVINATFLRKAIALLLCGVLSFNPIGWYGVLNYGEKADAASEDQAQSTVAPQRTPEKIGQAVSNPTVAGIWHGEWSDPAGYRYTFEANLTVSSGNISGTIIWKLIASPQSYDQSKLGLSATEYIGGAYNPENRLANMSGRSKDDPHNVIGLGGYKILIAEDGQSLTGETRDLGTWQGKMSGKRVVIQNTVSDNSKLGNSKTAIDLAGIWNAEGYKCQFSTYHEVINIKVSGNSLLATKVDSDGDRCVRTGSRTFSGSIRNTSVGSSFPIIWVIGKPDSPASGTASRQLTIVDANTLSSTSSAGERVTFRRKK